MLNTGTPKKETALCFCLNIPSCQVKVKDLDPSKHVARSYAVLRMLMATDFKCFNPAWDQGVNCLKFRHALFYLILYFYLEHRESVTFLEALLPNYRLEVTKQ